MNVETVHQHLRKLFELDQTMFLGALNMLADQLNQQFQINNVGQLTLIPLERQTSTTSDRTEQSPPGSPTEQSPPGSPTEQSSPGSPTEQSSPGSPTEQSPTRAQRKQRQRTQRQRSLAELIRAEKHEKEVEMTIRYHTLRRQLQQIPLGPLPDIPRTESVFEELQSAIETKDFEKFSQLDPKFCKMGTDAKMCRYICSYFIFVEFSKAGQGLSKELFIEDKITGKEEQDLTVKALILRDKLFCLIGENQSLLAHEAVLLFPSSQINLLSCRP